MKPGVLEIQGKLVYLQRLWKIEEDDDRYPGEYAMGPVNLDNNILSDAGIGWIASGDVELVEG